MNNKVYLSDLKVGEKGVIKKLNFSDKKIRRHLLDLGVTVGAKVEIKRRAPMNDPVDIIVRGYELAIRKKDLQNIEVEVTV